MDRPPSPAARVALVAANLAAAGACGFAWAGIGGFGDDRLLPLARVFLGVGAICLFVGVPGGLVAHPGVRSLSRALAAVGIMAGGVVLVVLTATAL